MRIAYLAVLSVAVAAAGTLPVAFEPNRGQDAARADFLVHLPGQTLALQANRSEWISANAHLATVFSGARTTVRGQGEGQLPGSINYLLGQDSSRWLRGIPTYSRVRYSAVYPGIDLVYYAKDGRLEYDFDVAPGADPRKIRMQFEGAKRIRLDAAGDLVIETGVGELRQHRPVIYQSVAGVRQEIAGRYRLQGSSVRLDLGSYDRALPLVIDPALTWATYFLPSSTAAAQAEAVAFDSSGNIYLAGSVLRSNNSIDGFIAKLNPAGTTAIYTTVFGGSYDDYAHGIAVDASGNLLVAGETGSPDFPADGSYVNYYPGYSEDAFLLKVDTTGQGLVYSHFYGGSGGEAAYGVALDASGNAFLVGGTNSTDMIVSTTPLQARNGGGLDAFVAEFSPSGAGVYATYLGGSADDAGNAIAVDAAGNAYISGNTASTNFPLSSSPYQGKYAGAGDVFVAKLAPTTGALVFSTYLGGAGADYANGIALDSSGSIYVTGETASTDFPVLGAFQATNAGGAGDAFVTRLDGSGSSLIYSTYLGGTGEDGGYGITVDAGGNAYITGATSSKDYPLADAFQGTNPGTTNSLVTALDATGSTLLFSSYLGGSGSAATNGVDYGNAAAVSCSNGLVVAGSTQSNNFPATSGALASTYLTGSSNGYVARIPAGGGVPSISAGGVVNGATFSASAVAPGSLISIFGANLALAGKQATTTPLPTTLVGATVNINNTPSPIVYASAGQLNVQLPYEARTGSAVVMVGGQCGNSAPVIFDVAQAAPYLFQSGSGDAIVQNQDGTINSASNPAAVASVITVYLTGIGPLDNAVPTGAPAPLSPLSRATLSKSATIGGWDAPVAFLGLTPQFVGLAQANLVVPGLSAGSYAVVVTVGGVASNGPQVYVKP